MGGGIGGGGGGQWGGVEKVPLRLKIFPIGLGGGRATVQVEKIFQPLGRIFSAPPPLGFSIVPQRERETAGEKRLGRGCKI